MTTPDDFAQDFDAIEIAHASTGEPGFYLADDAGGRFVVDRQFGVVSLRDEALLASERGAVHSVKLRVVEATGESYELEMKLRLTGLVPQMVGAEELFADVDPPIVPWSQFSPLRGRQTAQPLAADGAFGALIAPQLPPSNERIALGFGETLPAPAPSQAAWPV